MKKLISLTLAALLLLNLAACGESSVSNPSGSSGDSSSSADPAQPDAFSPVTTEAEVGALYGDDASLITSIEEYQGDFLVKLGTDEELGLGLRPERHPPSDAVAGYAPASVRDRVPGIRPGGHWRA